MSLNVKYEWSQTLGGIHNYNTLFAHDHTVALINECAMGLDNCDVNAVCTDTTISFECACLSGYSGDGVTCTSKNMCMHL